MITSKDFNPISYEEYSKAQKGSCWILLDDTVYMLFCMGDGEIIEKTIINSVKSIVSFYGSDKYAYLTTNGELHIVDNNQDKIIHRGNFTKLISGAGNELFAFTKTGVMVFRNDYLTHEIDYGLNITDSKLIYMDKDLSLVMVMADGDLYFGPYNLKKRWQITTNGACYKRFGKHDGVITDRGVIIKGMHYVLNDEPHHLVTVKKEEYVIALYDYLLYLKLDGQNFSINQYPADFTIYDIHAFDGILLIKNDEGAGILELEDIYKNYV